MGLTRARNSIRMHPRDTQKSKFSYQLLLLQVDARNCNPMSNFAWSRSRMLRLLKSNRVASAITENSPAERVEKRAQPWKAYWTLEKNVEEEKAYGFPKGEIVAIYGNQLTDV